MRHLIFYALICCLVVFYAGAANAGGNCTLVVDHETSAIIHESGDCKTRRGAQSTFKIPLALMGFDSGILKDAHNPVWPYDPAYQSSRAEERAETDPTRWEKESVIWFSQQLTRQLGMDSFRSYLKKFNYGNRDISGDPGKDNGLTNSWLSSSLKISPVEQVGFINGLLNRKYNIKPHAYDKTLSIIPEFSTDGWAIHGKTGTGFKQVAPGKIDRNLQEGWFAGWAEKDGRTIVFANFIADNAKEETYAGPRARDSFLKNLPAIMAHDRHHEH